MLFHTYGQARVFLSMLYCGLLIGAWYDLLAVVRRVLEAGRYLTAFLDMVFSLGVAVALVGFLLLTNFGEMRGYCLLGAACGAVLYALTIHPLLKLVVGKPFALLVRLLKSFRQTALAKKIFR